MELILESNANPAGKAYQEALHSQGQPAAQFLVSDVQAEHDRLDAKGVKSTMPVTSTTGSIIAVLDDTCGNLIQLTHHLGLRRREAARVTDGDAMSMATRRDTQSPALHVADSHDLIRVQGRA